MIRSIVIFFTVGLAGFAAEPTFRVHQISGKDTSKTFTSDTLQSTWITIRREKASLPTPPDGPQMIFRNGDRLPIDLNTVKLVGESLTFTHTIFGEKIQKAPLSSVAALWQAAPINERAFPFIRQLVDQKRDQDLVLLQNGDSVKGILSAIDAKQFKLDVEGETVTVAREKTATIAFFGKKSDPTALPHILATLKDGARITLKSIQLKNGTVQGVTVRGSNVSIPLDQLIALRRFQKSVIYLSDLESMKYEHRPYLSLNWKLQRDASVTEDPLTLRDGAHDKGLGMHSASTVTYHIPKDAEWFESRVALDAKTGKRGHVVIAVLIDGKEIKLPSSELSASQKVSLRLKVNGGKTLTLRVDFGKRGDVGDHVNWVGACFLLSESKAGG